MYREVFNSIIRIICVSRKVPKLLHLFVCSLWLSMLLRSRWHHSNCIASEQHQKQLILESRNYHSFWFWFWLFLVPCVPYSWPTSYCSYYDSYGTCCQFLTLNVHRISSLFLPQGFLWNPISLLSLMQECRGIEGSWEQLSTSRIGGCCVSVPGSSTLWRDKSEGCCMQLLGPPQKI